MNFKLSNKMKNIQYMSYESVACNRYTCNKVELPKHLELHAVVLAYTVFFTISGYSDLLVHVKEKYFFSLMLQNYLIGLKILFEIQSPVCIQ